MHIEYQIACGIALQYADEQQPRQECLARAALAEHAVAALDQFVYVQAEFHFHIHRVADVEIARVFIAEHGAYVFL